MYAIHFELDFDGQSDPEVIAQVVTALTDALAVADEWWLRGNPWAPRLYASGVRYQAEKGREEFFDVARVLKQGHADCEDLSAWRVAELRIEGVEARPLVTWGDARGFTEYHVQVWTPNGIEDPSLNLGMR